MALRVSTTSEPPMQASKWLTSAVLLDTEEMKDLFTSLGDFNLYLCGAVNPKGTEILSSDTFLHKYQAYIDQLKAGYLPDQTTYQTHFSPAMSATEEALYIINVGADKQIVRVAHPVIQLQAHHMDYSPVDKKFRSMVYGSNNITWGIQFSYPQQYLDATTKQIIQVKSPEYPNTKLFRQLQKWLRENSIPTPFIVENVLQNVPIRLGKKCLPWINRHPQLIKKEITVKNS